ncbi:alpha/beta fold hydrolase [Marinobacter sp. OP 3.4]|uniref:alpha/beta fold hydrolase n=1 Tax=Marinobacter sp. OP 3.4 TaxID=3076501 RepID=UPI002E243B7F
MATNYQVDDIQLDHFTIDGITTRVATLGAGPAVLLIHGWPECWYSWRQQIVALAEAGYQAVAPDMPGFGETDPLPTMEDYNARRIGQFLLALCNRFGGTPATIIAHDWGATNTWNFALQYPDAVARLVILSVPLRPPTEVPPTEAYRRHFGERFFYQLYFQAPGKAEAAFDENPREILEKLFCSPDTPREAPRLGKTLDGGGGWLERLGKPREQPDWLTDADLDYVEQAYRHSGFEGGLNYYRNIDRNWELMAPFADRSIDCPTLFIAGTRDNVLARAGHGELDAMMTPRIPRLSIRLLEGYGHWIQQEAPDAVNDAIVGFLSETDPRANEAAFQ